MHVMYASANYSYTNVCTEVCTSIYIAYLIIFQNCNKLFIRQFFFFFTYLSIIKFYYYRLPHYFSLIFHYHYCTIKTSIENKFTKNSKHRSSFSLSLSRLRITSLSSTKHRYTWNNNRMNITNREHK